jgi:outer membrane autotransporter protein
VLYTNEFHDELIASLSLPKKETKNSPLYDSESIWFEVIGALAYQKAQHQTVGFNPLTAGVILAYDHKFTKKWRLGGGLAYLFTHIHEKKNQGHSNINQEDAFVYSSWDNQQFYIDMLLLAGAVQIDQLRNTLMSGFAFRSSSHPKGWQCLPHLELGFKLDAVNQSRTSKFCLNPFAMLDWANAWQDSYKEEGDSPFNSSQKSYYGSLLRTEAGLRFYETLFFTSWNLTIQEKISYVNTQSFNAGKVNAFLVGSPGSFTVETLSSPQNLGVAQLAMCFDLVNRGYPITTLFYQAEFGSHYQSHQLNLELGWQF